MSLPVISFMGHREWAYYMVKKELLNKMPPMKEGDDRNRHF